jgi:hypothetical protein
MPHKDGPSRRYRIETTNGNILRLFIRTEKK